MSLLKINGDRIPSYDMIAVSMRNKDIFHMNKAELDMRRNIYAPMEGVMGSIIIESYLGYRNSHNVEEYNEEQQRLVNIEPKINAVSLLNWISDFISTIIERVTHIPFHARNVYVKERMPLLHQSLSILATLNRNKIYLYEFFDKNHIDKRVAEFSINIPDSKHGYVAMWNRSEMSTIGVGTDGGVFIMRNIYPEIGTKNITGHYTCDFLAGYTHCKIDTIDFDPYGENVIGTGPGICGFILWDLTSGRSFNYYSSTEQVKILKYSPDGDFILTVSNKNEIIIWYRNALYFQKAHVRSHGEIACAEWRPAHNEIIFFFKNPGSINMLKVNVSRHGYNLISAIWADVPIPQQLRLLNIDSMAHIRAILWGEKGEKLALAIGSPHAANGCMALLSITLDGVHYINDFIGYARPKAWSDVIVNRGVHMGFSAQYLDEYNGGSLICMSDNGAMSFMHIDDF